jgi:ribosomal protein L5
MARLQEFYKEKVVADLVAKFGYKSAMEVPRLTKITLNMDCWPKASRHQGSQGNCRFQNP